MLGGRVTRAWSHVWRRMSSSKKYIPGLAEEELGSEVSVTGWLAGVRPAGPATAFATVRDREGVIQVVVDGSADELPPLESVVQVKGRIEARPSRQRRTSAVNAIGELEIHAKAEEVVTVAAAAKELPMSLVAKKNAPLPAEALRLANRHLDLRRPELVGNLLARAAFLSAARSVVESEGFVEVETPILFKSTPEGAREFVVPARAVRGAAYALPQSPQQYKQLLMSAGIDRYYQVARCFRDEDSRADRQPEFTQLDIEASFVTAGDIQGLIERVVSAGVPASLRRAAGHRPQLAELAADASALSGLQHPFPRVSYAQAMADYGSDKPDMRSREALLQTADGLVGFRVAKLAGALSKRKLGEVARPDGDVEMGKGAYVLGVPSDDAVAARNKVLALGGSETSLGRLAETFGAEAGDALVVAPEAMRPTLGKLRLHALKMAAEAGVSQPVAHSATNFTWITDFPLFEVDASSGAIASAHHPFTAPHVDDVELLAEGMAAYKATGETKQLLEVRAQSYDLVLNGAELGGGSIRIHQPELQRAVLRDVLGVTEPDALFGHLLRALGHGTPPHGGVALGIDRLMATLLDTGIRDVIAFPKAGGGRDLLTGAPSTVDLSEYLATK
ncbi:aspartyl-tRNA synthetase [Thecamonas trahens ATCC 50062]|uniref:Aspartyl-tRNA synthetase n=1 Tax=Thecamonas trahens ATCC 50062 TaxID=461836 RepID=A0A0L0D9U7_THETB|nr:aspartyl-tRNA synthetase [Thecamonas trahens ATCC 50062]KNC49025.1 aspartyl-tRNA synthetase [Thecamonas trahens ATCC 50062]|eukprot:XP_013758435.1 aspartyl-tRNA synthetase [Thecamonas trahens ATCC 50062]